MFESGNCLAYRARSGSVRPPSLGVHHLTTWGSRARSPSTQRVHINNKDSRLPSLPLCRPCCLNLSGPIGDTNFQVPDPHHPSCRSLFVHRRRVETAVQLRTPPSCMLIPAHSDTRHPYHPRPPTDHLQDRLNTIHARRQQGEPRPAEPGHLKGLCRRSTDWGVGGVEMVLAMGQCGWAG